MDVAALVRIDICFLAALTALIILQVWRMSVDDSHHLDKQKFRRGLTFTAKFTALLLCVSIALSLLTTLAFYRGLCPREYTGYFIDDSRTVVCPFWQFYVQSTVRAFYGDPLP
jgi:hypothetical protein